ncbi:hypothetical protein MKX01_005268 [Papaver californicum]|nr:hypothetical protein MKX01_005268 [Papaver californicum]
MAERQQTDQQLQSSQQGEDMIACLVIGSCLASMLACEKATIDVERHARDFMEAAKKLQLYFIGLQHEELPVKEVTLQKEIAELEEEVCR